MKTTLLRATTLGMFVVPVMLLAASAAADDLRFQYAAKFVCGLNPTPVVRILPGQYATAVNIHNPGYEPVVLRERVALTFPPAQQEAGPVSETIEVKLGPNQALEVDCGEIPSQFFPPELTLPPYIQGFLVIESSESLDVTAIYTAAPANPAGTAVQTVDVEQVPERRLGGERRQKRANE